MSYFSRQQLKFTIIVVFSYSISGFFSTFVLH